MTPTQRKASALEVLKTLEWQELSHEYRESEYFCPVCDRDKQQGHEAGCDLAAALAEPAPEPACYQYQSREGTWHPFINDKHHADTAADGRWPIRALYAAPVREPAPEPVGWSMTYNGEHVGNFYESKTKAEERMADMNAKHPLDKRTIEPLYAAPVREPAQTTSYQWLAEMIMADLGYSSNDSLMLAKITGRIIAHDRANAAPVREPAQTTCNCRWEGGAQVQHCALHQSHEDAIHDWAERAKTAEAKLKQQPAPVPLLTDEEIRATYLANGFTVKEGQTDLKQYVFASARAIESLVRQKAGIK